jgi:hypothetical protein
MKKINKPLVRTHTANDLVDVFLELIDLERQVENTKTKLAEHTDFNLYDAFKIFDQLSKGSLTITEVANGLIKIVGLVPSSCEIELFFQRYDKDHDGLLRFSEFCDAFVPMDRDYAALLNSRQSNRRNNVYGNTRADYVFLPQTILGF